MAPWQNRRLSISGDVAVLLLLASIRLLVHVLTNHQYGFHRDELAVVDNARYLAWGYVAYPPLTPAIARLALEIFGPSLVGLRFFSALAQSIAMVLAGLMAGELGAGRGGQVFASLATAFATIALVMGTLFQYVSFDYLWWVLIAYLVVRLLKSDDARWWPAIGAVIGLGMMTKYTIAVCVAALVLAVLLTPTRRHLRSPWLWGGVALSLLIFLPNLIWQFQHDFVSLDFLNHIRARDIRIGRTDDFLLDQLRLAANPFTLPLWIAGLVFYLASKPGRRYRLLGWMAVFCFLIFWILRGRGYYMGPVYPMLFAGGAVWGEQWLATLPARRAGAVRITAWTLLAVGAVTVAILVLPIAPVNSAIWNVATAINEDVKEQIGWPDLVAQVAAIYNELPAEERQQTGILAGNYGEAGVINLYGPAYGLPTAISGVNSYWQRGYGDPPPQTLIVLGFDGPVVDVLFERCTLAGQVTNRYGVANEETLYHPDIFVCRGLRRPWPEFWQDFQTFG